MVNIGDLIKLKVPPFSVGIVIDATPEHNPTSSASSSDSQLLAVMWQDYDTLRRGSRIPNKIAAEISSFISWTDQTLFDTYGFPDPDALELCNEIVSFVERNTERFSSEQMMLVMHHSEAIFRWEKLDGTLVLRKNRNPVSIISTHRKGHSNVHLISKATSSEEFNFEQHKF